MELPKRNALNQQHKPFFFLSEMTPIIIKFGTEGQLRECQFKSSLN
jgi:hypothetical protein